MPWFIYYQLWCKETEPKETLTAPRSNEQLDVGAC